MTHEELYRAIECEVSAGKPWFLHVDMEPGLPEKQGGRQVTEFFTLWVSHDGTADKGLHYHAQSAERLIEKYRRHEAHQNGGLGGGIRLTGPDRMLLDEDV